MTAGLEDVLSALEGVARQGDQFKARCPAHDDRNPSLSVGERNGRLLLHCHAGCKFEAVAEALAARGVRLNGAAVDRTLDPIVQSYRYHDEAGNHVFTIHRTFRKRFKAQAASGAWTVPEADRILYRLHEVVKSPFVFVAEGERDADTVAALGLTATCNPFGAGKWLSRYADRLAGKRVYILPDWDVAGFDHANQVLASLRGKATDARIVLVPNPDRRPKFDATDWVRTLGDVEPAEVKRRLKALVAAAEPWKPLDPATAPDAKADPVPDEAPDLEIPVPTGPPDLDPRALHGPLGRFVELVRPLTEADPAGILFQALAVFGCYCGRGAWVELEATKHYPNQFVLLVGQSAKSRKGTALDHVRALFNRVDSDWVLARWETGLSSGEGLIHAVRDKTEAEQKGKHSGHGVTTTETVVTDEGEGDKRLTVIESEFGGTLKILAREGNSLSAVLRNAWDGKPLGTMTRKGKLRCVEPCVTVIGHVTEADLSKYLDETDCRNGLVNRFLFVAVRRRQLRPDYTPIPEEPMARLADELRDAADFARSAGRIALSAAAARAWRELYPDLTREVPGVLGDATARSEPQTMRLALLFALADRSPVIEVAHLTAAVAAWEFCFESARMVFGDATGNRDADRILQALRLCPDGLTQTAVSDLFDRHLDQGRIAAALGLLTRYGLVNRTNQQGDRGRPSIVWKATH